MHDDVSVHCSRTKTQYKDTVQDTVQVQDTSERSSSTQYKTLMFLHFFSVLYSGPTATKERHRLRGGVDPGVRAFPRRRAKRHADWVQSKKCRCSRFQRTFLPVPFGDDGDHRGGVLQQTRRRRGRRGRRVRREGRARLAPPHVQRQTTRQSLAHD